MKLLSASLRQLLLGLLLLEMYSKVFLVFGDTIVDVYSGFALPSDRVDVSFFDDKEKFCVCKQRCMVQVSCKAATVYYLKDGISKCVLTLQATSLYELKEDSQATTILKDKMLRCGTDDYEFVPGVGCIKLITTVIYGGFARMICKKTGTLFIPKSPEQLTATWNYISSKGGVNEDTGVWIGMKDGKWMDELSERDADWPQINQFTTGCGYLKYPIQINGDGCSGYKGGSTRPYLCERRW